MVIFENVVSFIEYVKFIYVQICKEIWVNIDKVIRR